MQFSTSSHVLDFLCQGSTHIGCPLQVASTFAPARPSLRLPIFSLSKPHHVSAVKSLKNRSPSFTCRAFEADRSEPVAEPSPVQSEAAKRVKIGIYFATWWGLNVIFNIYNKKVLNAYRFPWLTSKLSSAAGSLKMLVYWALRIAEAPKTGLDFWKSLSPVAVAHTIGHVATTVSMSKVAVSFTHIIKSGEPAFSVLVSIFILGEMFPPSVYLSLLRIIGGCGLAAHTELNFNMIGFMGARISNLAFVFWSIFSKRGMKGKSVSWMSDNACLSILSLYLLTAFPIAFEGPQLCTPGLKNRSHKLDPKSLELGELIKQQLGELIKQQDKVDAICTQMDESNRATTKENNLQKKVAELETSIQELRTQLEDVRKLVVQLSQPLNDYIRRMEEFQSTHP